MKLTFLKKILPLRFSKYLLQVRYNYATSKIINDEEKSFSFLARKTFYQQILNKGDTYFDIGANYGNRIGPILKMGVKKIIAVEPQRECCDHLKRFYPSIKILQKGVGDERTVKPFYISDKSVLSSFSEEFIATTQAGRFKNTEWKQAEMVEIITLDDLINDYGMPDFIKIDVEGYELEVINGLSQKVRILSFEYTTPELAHKLEPILSKLKSLGDYTFNYAVEESMQFNLNEWIEADRGIELVKSNEFLQTGFGDIYIKFNND
ncbi:MAG: methyltransferase, FkbM family [Ferruginibacter sp.]|uniref:FkbM family methyltransferase n=1 Tax=Ferruginibacter sp. TaxID=1940288 RepID=UPI00265A58D4|nr:FkbM family methyltransferase [Ferruginibacter sp.]MDB5280354.1 methyltransferase, FkbM family [Ferruginibacter sp.]